MISGSCLCGAVRYEAAQPLSAYHCHCTNCQKWSGSAFASVLRAPLSSLRIVSGARQLTRYRSSPNVNRCFCGRCGSSLFTERHDLGWVHLRMGALDDDAAPRPQFHVWVASKAPWCDIKDDLPQSQGSALGGAGASPPALEALASGREAED